MISLDSHPHKKILFVAKKNTASLIALTALVQALKTSYPSSFVGVWCELQDKAFFFGNPHVDYIHVREAEELFGENKNKSIFSFFMEFKKEGYQTVFFLSPDWRSILFSILLRIPIRVGFVSSEYRRGMTHAIPRENQEFLDEDQLRLMMSAIGLKAPDKKAFLPRLSISTKEMPIGEKWIADQFKEKTNLVIFAPYSPSLNNCWPTLEWRSFLRAWREDNPQDIILVVAEQLDWKKCEHDFSPVLDSRMKIMSAPSLGFWKILISLSSYVVGVKSSSTELARSLGIPTLAFHFPGEARLAPSIGSYVSFAPKSYLDLPMKEIMNISKQMIQVEKGIAE